MDKRQVIRCVKLERMSQVNLRERLVQTAVAQCVIRCVTLVAGAETEERGVRRSIRIGKRLAILIARLEAETSRHSATNFNHACVKPALLGVVKVEAETECGWAVVEEVNRSPCGGGICTEGSGVCELTSKTGCGAETDYVWIRHGQQVDERRICKVSPRIASCRVWIHIACQIRHH